MHAQLCQVTHSGQQLLMLLVKPDMSSLALQVLFSSSVMYGNFVTIAQRRALAREAQEYKDR